MRPVQQEVTAIISQVGSFLKLCVNGVDVTEAGAEEGEGEMGGNRLQLDLLNKLTRLENTIMTQLL